MPKHMTRIEPVSALPDATLYEEGYPVLLDGVIYTADGAAWKGSPPVVSDTPVEGTIDPGVAIGDASTGLTAIGWGGVVGNNDGAPYDVALVSKGGAASSEATGVGAAVQANFGSVAVGAYAIAGGMQDVVIGAYSGSAFPLVAIAAVTGVSHTNDTGSGTLPSGSWFYRIIASNAGQFSDEEAVAELATSAGGTITLNWTDPAVGAFDAVHIFRYAYRNDRGVSVLVREYLGQVAPAVETFVDDGSVAPGEAPNFVGDHLMHHLSYVYTYNTFIGTEISGAVGVEYASALGAGAGADYSYSTAVGAGATPTREHQVMLGTAAEVATAPGGLELAVSTVTAAFTVDSTDHQTVILADATGGAFNVQLPVPVAGRIVIVKKIDVSANAVTVTTPGAETIDGAGTHALAAQYDAVRMATDGVDWFVI